ncbi:cellulose binding domain-containing protein, partial [Catenulispora sp. NF23]|uniref:cellulose binding domain-containing protein n=1 Tax=Catenulispora pinistramenti TaxID=2705254 RepID=UPI001BA656E1
AHSTAPAAGKAAATPLPTAVYSKISDWGSGFQGQYVITNPMTVPLNTWSLQFALPATESVTSMWGGTETVSGTTHTVAAQSFDTTIAAGASVTIGFDASYSGTYADPSACQLNSDPCDGSADQQPPTAPSALTVLSTTSSAASLSWTGSTDNVTVAGYNVYSGSTIVATSPGTAATVTNLSPSTSYSFTVRAYDEAGNLSAPSAAVSATTLANTGGGHLPGVAAPFVDIGAWPTPDLTQIAETTGLRQFSLGFIVNGTVTCSPSWFNAYAMSAGFEQSDIASLRAIGGDVKPSFGGEAGTELAQSCTDVPSLTAAYQSAITAYNLTQIDFDIEGSAVADPASIDRRSQAIAALQQSAAAAGKPLTVTLTLPILPSGLTSDGLYVVQSAVKYGAKIALVNGMAMDFGDIEAPNPSGQMGKYAIDTAQSLYNQLTPLYPALTPAQVWNMIGVTPMIGQNDDSSEVFYQSDMQQLLTFAEQQHLGELAFWDVTRDGNACTGSLSKCTDITQTPYEFSKMIAPYQG